MGDKVSGIIQGQGSSVRLDEIGDNVWCGEQQCGRIQQAHGQQIVVQNRGLREVLGSYFTKRQLGVSKLCYKSSSQVVESGDPTTISKDVLDRYGCDGRNETRRGVECLYGRPLRNHVKPTRSLVQVYDFYQRFRDAHTRWLEGRTKERDEVRVGSRSQGW